MYNKVIDQNGNVIYIMRCTYHITLPSGKIITRTLTTQSWCLGRAQLKGEYGVGDEAFDGFEH